MPTIRLSKELYAYLEHSSDGASMDSTIRRLLHLGLLRGRIVQKQVNRKLIAPKEAYTWSVLDAFGEDKVLSRKELQRRVGDSLKAKGLFQIYPADNELMNHRQPRWKVRFGDALTYLRECGCLESLGEYEHNYQGGTYSITEDAQGILDDYDLYINPSSKLTYLTHAISVPQLDDLGNPYSPKPVEDYQIPDALVGRKRGRINAEA